MAQQQWNYYVPPTSTASNVNTIVDSVKNAVRRSDQLKEKQAADAERKRLENKRDLELNRKINEEQLNYQQNSMLGFGKAISDAGAGKEYANVLNQTYTLDDKREFADLSRQVATKSCGACTEQLSRISEMKAQPGVTKTFLENLYGQFTSMDTDIEAGKFDVYNNPNIVLLRGLLSNNIENRDQYNYGIRKNADGTQELWMSGPKVKANKDGEYVINSAQLSKAADNGSGIYASSYDANKELETIQTQHFKDEEGNYREEWLEEKIYYKVDPEDPTKIIGYKNRKKEAGEQRIKQEITANVTADFDNPAKAIATWNTDLKNTDEEAWSYAEWNNLSDEEKTLKRTEYQDRMTERFNRQFHGDYNKPVVVSKSENPNPISSEKEIINDGAKLFARFESDLKGAFSVAYPSMSDNINIDGDKVTVTLASEDMEEEPETASYDLNKQSDYIKFYEMLRKGSKNFITDSKDEGRREYRKAVISRFKEKNKERLKALDALEKLRNQRPILGPVTAPGFEAREN